jgi:uncharacterized protein YukJ
MDRNIPFIFVPREDVHTVGHPVQGAAGDTCVNTHGGWDDFLLIKRRVDRTTFVMLQ